jgi:hypothetical protein
MIKLINERIDLKLEGVYTACTALVTQLLQDKTYANVKLEDPDETELFKIPLAPYLKYIHYHDPEIVSTPSGDVAGPPVSIGIQEGDRVLIVFSKYPLERNSKRRFNINDALVVAKL